MGTESHRIEIMERLENDLPCVINGDELDPLPGSARPAGWKRDKRAKKKAARAAKKRNRRP